MALKVEEASIPILFAAYVFITRNLYSRRPTAFLTVEHGLYISQNGKFVNSQPHRGETWTDGQMDRQTQVKTLSFRHAPMHVGGKKYLLYVIEIPHVLVRKHLTISNYAAALKGNDGGRSVWEIAS